MGMLQMPFSLLDLWELALEQGLRDTNRSRVEFHCPPAKGEQFSYPESSERRQCHHGFVRFPEMTERPSKGRNRALDAIKESIANGDDPVRVAALVLEALTSRSPRPRYAAGREAKFLSWLSKWAPTKLLDKGLRKQFGLEAA